MSEKHKNTRKPLDAIKTIRDVMADEEFIPNLERVSGNMQQAFTLTAMALVELGTSDSGYRPRSVDQLHVAYTIDAFVAAKTALDSGNHHPAQTKGIKTEVIAFNHALSRLIDNDPGADQDEVVTYLESMYKTIRPLETDARYTYVKRSYKEILTGMTEEIIVEQLAGRLGYEMERNVSAEEEMKGIDGYLGINGVWEGVDVKSSKERADERRAKDRKGHYVITTGVPKRVIGSRFRLNQDELDYYAPQFQEELDREYARVTTLRRKRNSQYHSRNRIA